jgi:GR25 family glycosyltransferase involved in LPS biosynthesis
MLEAFRRLGIAERPNLFFTAIDGKVDTANIPHNMKKGTWACARSMAAVMVEAAERKKPLLVLEDDVVIHPQIHSIMDAVLAELPVDWKVLYLGYVALEAHEKMPTKVLPKSTKIGKWTELLANPNLNHAFIIRDVDCLTELSTLLSDPATYDYSEGYYASDYAIAQYFSRKGIPMYGVSPNVASQCGTYSDNDEKFVYRPAIFNPIPESEFNLHAIPKSPLLDQTRIYVAACKEERIAKLPRQLARLQQPYTIERRLPVPKDQQQWWFNECSRRFREQILTRIDVPLLWLEDDADIPPHFLEVWSDYEKTLPTDWKIAVIGWRYLHDGSAKIRRTNQGWWHLEGKSFYGTQAVLVNRGEWRRGFADKEFLADTGLLDVLRELGIFQIYHSDKILIGAGDPTNVFGEGVYTSASMTSPLYFNEFGFREIRNDDFIAEPVLVEKSKPAIEFEPRVKGKKRTSHNPVGANYGASFATYKGNVPHGGCAGCGK